MNAHNAFIKTHRCFKYREKNMKGCISIGLLRLLLYCYHALIPLLLPLLI